MRQKDLARYLAIGFLTVMIGLSQAYAQKPTPTPERPRAIGNLLNDARLAAPELAVDTFLKVLETKKVTDAVWRKEILDEALRMIDDVQYPMPMRPAFGGDSQGTLRSLNDTEVAILAGAYGLKLDRLSFKGRAITLLLETDRERARQMIFQMGGQFGLKPRTCEDALAYATDDIYQVVVKVAKAVFNEKQIDEGHRALFVAPWIENIESPRQIYPALDLVHQFRDSAAEQQLLFNAASRAINRDFKDDRSFTYAWEAITARIQKLTGGHDQPHKSDLRNAFRGMLLKNLGIRCKDNEIKKDQPLPAYIEAANKLMPEKPVAHDDVVTSKIEGTAKLKHLLNNPAMKKLRDELIEVRGTKIVDNKVVNHDLTDAAWVSRVNEFVDRVLAFEGADGDTESELFFIRTGLLAGMISGINPGELRNSIVRKYLRQVAASPLQKKSFIEWRGWLREVEHWAPESFAEIAGEFHNPNLKVILAVNKLLAEPAKPPPVAAAPAKPPEEAPKPTPKP